VKPVVYYHSLQNTLIKVVLTIALTSLCLPACASRSSPTPFIAPKAAAHTSPLLPGEAPRIPTFTPPAEPTAIPTSTPPCTDGLEFVEDLTIPDGTIVPAATSIEKQWSVQNSGSCNWDARYRLKFVGGLELGAAVEQALYPARAGTLATLRITFIAPAEPGNYTTAWQAFGPDGLPFGDAIYMEIVVQ
jgi:hypothetical protein